MTDLQLAIDAARAAGEIIKEGFLSIHSISEKENKSLVTEIDTGAENAILKILGNSYPILAEETKSTTKNENTFWAVDPLDGTTNFVYGIALCCTSIALIKSGTVKLGVIYNSLTNELFTAEKGKGAFLNGKSIHVSSGNKLIFVNAGYAPEHRNKFSEVVAKTAHIYSLRRFGATAYELATVARGASDGFVAWGDELWDHAAGILLVREAGGIVTDWKGNEWTTDTNYVLAANPSIHPELLKITSNL